MHFGEGVSSLRVGAAPLPEGSGERVVRQGSFAYSCQHIISRLRGRLMKTAQAGMKNTFF